MVDNLHFVKKLGLEIMDALEAGDFRGFGQIMNVHWDYKKKRSAAISNPCIDAYYDLALQNGAIGGKLIGAGGGGFLMFVVDDKPRVRRALTEAGLREIRLRFDYEGTKVLVQ